MDENLADEQNLERLHALIAETMQRCMTFERLIATCVANGLSPDGTDKALAASQDVLRYFREHAAVVEGRIRARRQK